MATSRDPNVPVMLTLAGLTYRGFFLRQLVGRLSADLHELAVRRAVAQALADQDIRAVIGEWTLVWGPATSHLRDDFDGSAMYVARSAVPPNRLVVAVRGTNPLALTDWVEGDLRVAKLEPWPFAGDGASISQSTAGGLSSVLRLTSPVGSKLAREIDELLSHAGRMLPGFVTELAGRVHLEPRPLPLQDLLAPLERTWRERAGRDTADLVGLVANLLGTAPGGRIGAIGWPPPPSVGGGTTLVDFLRAESRNAPLDVVVTGHSKGGALAPALALWLADTRDEWDTSGRASVGCYAYAGPTPGNGAFGKRVRSRVTGPCGRIVNSNDIVTHAWDESGIGSIAALYPPGLAWLAPIAAAIQKNLAANRYEHVDIAPETFAGTLLTSGGVPDSSPLQIVHQHMDAYLDYCGLAAKGVTTPKLFLG
jgi:hypothetical protein